MTTADDDVPADRRARRYGHCGGVICLTGSSGAGKSTVADIPEFTGVSAPYGPPQRPELDLNTERLTIDEAVDRLVTYAEERLRLDPAGVPRA